MLAMMFAAPCRDASIGGARAASSPASGLGAGSPTSPRASRRRAAARRDRAGAGERPPLILADEPCASLDAHTAREVLTEFWTVCRQDGKTLLVVSHGGGRTGRGPRVLDMAEINRADAHHPAARPA